MLLRVIVPLTGLPEDVHLILFFLMLGPIGSIITAYLFPKIFVPLFLKSKSLIFRKYEDAYVENTNVAASARVYIKRAIYCLLLTLGILAFIVPNIRESAVLFMGQNTYEEFVDLGIYPAYSMMILTTLVGILLPIVVGVWSIGWALEDAGLMHYRIEDERKGKEAYEIEPIHVKYNSFIRGYAGISSILFIIQVAAAFYSVYEIAPYRAADVIGVVFMPLSVLVFILPAYLLYIKKGINAENLRKDLAQIKQITKKDLIK